MGQLMDCASTRELSGPTVEQDKPRPERGRHRIELTASVLFGLPMLASAYHTSVLVDGEEFFFSDSGIFRDHMLVSHEGKPTERLELGYSDHSGLQLQMALDKHFKAGTYDLLRKNCNSFSDCALYFLLKQRLKGKYTILERLGSSGPQLVGQVTGGTYAPNPISASFNVEEVIKEIEKAPVPMPPPQQRHTSAMHRMAFNIGDEVRIVGLKTAVELNGETATVVRYNSLSGRWEVQIGSTGERKALRAEMLRPNTQDVALVPGDMVVIKDLQSEAGQALNGQVAEVMRYLPEVDRYEVVVNDGTKSLKPCNLSSLDSC